MSADTIDILLATYNGANFLEDQLKSIVAQTHTDWNLLISDDGSTDSTRQIIDQFIQQHSTKARYINQKAKGNASENFLGILEHSKSNYIAFCDQDDLWEPTKLEKSITLLKHLEKSDRKALVFSDMHVVSEKLEVIDQSFLQRQRLNPAWSNEKYKVFAQSIAAGCTMLFTRALVEDLYPIDSNIFQHDHWIMIHAASNGKIGYLDAKTVHYRQHDFNAVGANRLSTMYYAQKTVTIATLWKRWSYIKHCFGDEVKRWKIAQEKLTINLNRFIN